MIINEYIVETCTAVIRKVMYSEILKYCPYEFSEKFMMGDIQTWIEIAHRSEVKYIDESLAIRNILPESACHTKDLNKNILFLQNARTVILHYANKYGKEDSVLLKKQIIRSLNKLSSTFQRQHTAVISQRVQDNSYVLAGFNHFIEIANTALAYGLGKWSINPYRLAAFKRYVGCASRGIRSARDVLDHLGKRCAHLLGRG